MIVLLPAVSCGLILAQSGKDGRFTMAEAKKLKSPISYSKKSITQGKNLFLRNCTGCHGADGKAEVDVIGNATNLTSPGDFRSGASEGEIFRSIRDGAGDTMPSFKSQLDSEQDLWNLVNYIRSLWPESMRPPLQDTDDKTKKD